MHLEWKSFLGPGILAKEEMGELPVHHLWSLFIIRSSFQIHFNLIAIAWQNITILSLIVILIKTLEYYRQPVLELILAILLGMASDSKLKQELDVLPRSGHLSSDYSEKIFTIRS